LILTSFIPNWLQQILSQKAQMASSDTTID